MMSVHRNDPIVLASCRPCKTVFSPPQPRNVPKETMAWQCRSSCERRTRKYRTKGNWHQRAWSTTPSRPTFLAGRGVRHRGLLRLGSRGVRILQRRPAPLRIAGRLEKPFRLQHMIAIPDLLYTNAPIIPSCSLIARYQWLGASLREICLAMIGDADETRRTQLTDLPLGPRNVCNKFASDGSPEINSQPFALRICSFCWH
ncbi:hypothetical protein B0H14DRAFT_3566754 [Mycena olivaceomarginata]|nr:hypothetical protein B0H14DRAFT_3566754 [Mycena olivaceomarginata]